ncbi:MAG: signal peptidase I [Lactobacillus sp.]|nr:signal peptidase I [Lactobacillus sp.]
MVEEKKETQPEEKKGLLRSTAEVAGLTILMFAIWYVVFTFILANDSVSGPSMQPTFENNDRIISIRHFTKKRGQVVVIKAPDQPNTLYIKRLIGLPGDTVESKNDHLYVNGKEVNQSYLSKKWIANAHAAGMKYTNDFKVTVPKGYYWVMGDHRDVSNDSRRFGPVKANKIVSEVKLRYWPLTDISWF